MNENNVPGEDRTPLIGDSAGSDRREFPEIEDAEFERATNDAIMKRFRERIAGSARDATSDAKGPEGEPGGAN